MAAPLKEFITAAVLMRLDTPEMSDALDGRRAADEQQGALQSALDEDQNQLKELSELWGTKVISSVEWKAAREPIEARMKTTERQLARFSNSTTLDGLIGAGRHLKATWEALNLDRQAAIIKAVLDYATILPGTPGARALEPARIQPVWQL